MLTTTHQQPPFDLSALDRAQLADSTRQQYKNEILKLHHAGVNPLDAPALAAYVADLPHSSRRFLSAALRLTLADYVNKAKTSNAPVETIQRFIWRVEAMQETISAPQPARQRLPHWLSQAQITALLQSAQSQRDYVILSLLVQGLLRREELSLLTFDALRTVDGKDVLQLSADITKGAKPRTVPIPASLARRLNEWRAVVGDGRIARSMDRHGRIGKSMSVSGIFQLVRQYGQCLDMDDLDPHDLRRSAARLLYLTTRDIMKVQNLLGHANPKTTLTYIGDTLDTETVNMIGD